jgi:hypothetical protein
MARSSLTITDETAGKLRQAKAGLSYAAGRSLTMDGCVAYLLAHWLATHPVGLAVSQPAPDPEPPARRRTGARA